MSKKRSKSAKNQTYLMPDTSSMTLSERIREFRELINEIKVENDDKDVIYCETIKHDQQKVEMIRIFFLPQSQVYHMNKYHSKEVKKLAIQCKVCDLKVLNPHSLNVHMGKVHSKPERF